MDWILRYIIIIKSPTFTFTRVDHAPGHKTESRSGHCTLTKKNKSVIAMIDILQA